MRGVRVIGFVIFVVSVLETGAAMAQPGMTPPDDAPPSPPSASSPPGAPSPGHDDERKGLMLGSSLGFGRAIDGELRLGVMVRPNIAVFADVMGLVLRSDGGESDGASLMALGVRAWRDRVFFDARIGRLTTVTGCDDFDDPCVDTYRHYVAGQLGVGLDVVHTPHIGLELMLDVLIADRTVVPQGGFGISFYLF